MFAGENNDLIRCVPRTSENPWDSYSDEGIPKSSRLRNSPSYTQGEKLV